MKPSERAKELVDKFTTFHAVGYAEEMMPDIYQAKKHALVAVDYMIIAQRACYTKLIGFYEQSDQYNHLIKVKKEIELL